MGLPGSGTAYGDNDLPLDIATDKSEIPVQPKICFLSRLFGASGSIGHYNHIGTKNFPG